MSDWPECMGCKGRATHEVKVSKARNGKPLPQTTWRAWCQKCMLEWQGPGGKNGFEDGDNPTWRALRPGWKKRREREAINAIYQSAQVQDPWPGEPVLPGVYVTQVAGPGKPPLSFGNSWEESWGRNATALRMEQRIAAQLARAESFVQGNIVP